MHTHFVIWYSPENTFDKRPATPLRLHTASEVHKITGVWPSYHRVAVPNHTEHARQFIMIEPS